MKKTRRTMLILLSAAMMAGSLAGCSGSSSKPDESIEFTEAPSTEAATTTAAAGGRGPGDRRGDPGPGAGRSKRGYTQR